MKRGNLQLLGLMFAVVLFIGGVVLLEPIKEVTGIARTSLDCGGASVSMYVDMTCIVVGSFLPVYALLMLGAAAAVFGIRKVYNGGE